MKYIGPFKFLSKGARGHRSFSICLKILQLNAFRYGMLKPQSGWVFLIRARMGRARSTGEEYKGGPAATVATLLPRVCFLNLHANSTRLLGNISCLVYTNNVRHGYKLRKGNTNASEHRPQVKHFANDHLYCNGLYLRPEIQGAFWASLDIDYYIDEPPLPSLLWTGNLRHVKGLGRILRLFL